MDPNSNSSKISSVFSSAGSVTKSSLISSAKFISKGIDKSADFVKSHTSPPSEPSNVPFLSGIAETSKVTSSILGKSSEIIGQTMNTGLKFAEKKLSSNSESESEIMKKLNSSEAFQIGKQITKAGVMAGLDIVDGVSEGISIIKDSGVRNTVDVIEHSYGEEAGKAAQESFNIAGNVAGVCKIASVSGFVGASVDGINKIREQEELLQKTWDCLLGTGI